MDSKKLSEFVARKEKEAFEKGLRARSEQFDLAMAELVRLAKTDIGAAAALDKIRRLATI